MRNSYRRHSDDSPPGARTMSKQPTQARWTNELKEAAMNIKHIRAYLAVCSLVVVLQPLQGFAQQNSDGTKTGSQPATVASSTQKMTGSWPLSGNLPLPRIK